MNKLRLDVFLNLGYELVSGDKVTKLTGDTLTVSNNNASIYNNPKHYGADRRFVHSLCKLDISEIIKMTNGDDESKKQGKTVVDAVNYFKGETPNKEGSIIESIKLDPEYMDDLGSLHYSGLRGQDVDSEYYSLTCTIEEFNQCVKDMIRHNTSFETFKSYLDNNSPLEPVKPRMKVEYVGVNGNDKVIAACFSTGALYYMSSNRHDSQGTQYREITTIEELVVASVVYRKVETEITWQDELTAFVDKEQFNGGHVGAFDITVGEFSEISMNISFREGRFIEMCHLVSSMNK